MPEHGESRVEFGRHQSAHAQTNEINGNAIGDRRQIETILNEKREKGYKGRRARSMSEDLILAWRVAFRVLFVLFCFVTCALLSVSSAGSTSPVYINMRCFGSFCCSMRTYCHRTRSPPPPLLLRERATNCAEKEERSQSPDSDDTLSRSLVVIVLTRMGVVFQL